MVNLSIKATINLKFPKVNRIINEAIVKGLTKGALVVEGKMKRFAPLDTGRLTGSIFASKVKMVSDGFTVSVSPNVFYARYMERPGGLGVKSRAKGARRPFMKPALLESENLIISHLISEIRRVA